MPSAQQYAGLVEGVSGALDYHKERPVREARVNEALARQREAQLRLQEFEQGAPLRREQSEIEIENLRSELKTARHNSLRTDTYAAFDNYEADGDTRHLNNLLESAKKNPVGTSWQRFVRFDPVARTRQTEALLGQAGITDIDGYFADPNLMKSKVLATQGDGQQVIVDMNTLYAGTRYNQYARSQVLGELTERAKLDQMMRGTESAEGALIRKIKEEVPGRTYTEAAKLFYQMKNDGKRTGSDLERITEDLMAQDPTLTYEEAIKQASSLKAAPPAVAKNIEVVKHVRQQIHEAAGGDFYKAPLNDSATRSKVGELISDLEAATGKSLSEETKRTARQLRSLVSLGGTAGSELTDEETGLIDNLLFSVKKYFSDDTAGIEGASSYQTVRNFARNALMGATLTKGELSEFDKAVGTLKQQTGPVLAQLRVQLQDIKGQIESVMAFEDPMISKYYLGLSQDEAGKAIDQITNRIEYLNKYSTRQQKADEMELSPLPSRVTPVPDGKKPTKPAAERFKELTGGS